MKNEVDCLRFVVYGTQAQLRRTAAVLEDLCATHLGGRPYEIESVDVELDPARAERDRVLATPTVISHGGHRPRRVLGELTPSQQVVRALDLDAPAGHPTAQSNGGDRSSAAEGVRKD